MMKKSTAAIYILLGIIMSSPTKSAEVKVMTQGLSHLGLTVSKLDKTATFFTDVLGWRLIGEKPAYPAKFVTDGNMVVTLWQVTDINNLVSFNRKNNVGLHHLALAVASESDLMQLFKRFKNVDGVVIEFAPELNGNGPTMHMMIREPSGNRIEFSYKPKMN